MTWAILAYFKEAAVQLVKIEEYSLRQYGANGVTVTLPSVYRKDLGLKPGDKIGYYRSPDMPDALIIRPVRVQAKDGTE